MRYLSTLFAVTMSLTLSQGSAGAPQQFPSRRIAMVQSHATHVSVEHARINRIRGQVAAISEADLHSGGYGQRLTAGTAIPEGHLLATGDQDSFIEVQCPDGAIIKMWSNAIVQINTQQHTIELKSGNVEFCSGNASNEYKLTTKRLAVNSTQGATVFLNAGLSRDSVTVMEGDAQVTELATGLPWHP